MEANGDFLQQLTEAVASRQEQLEQTELPNLKETLALFHSSVTGITSILLRKSLLQEDPYKNDKKISELTVPAVSEMPEMERQSHLSIRLSDYDSQLAFLIDYFPFTLESLNLQQIKKILGLVNFIKWDQLSATSLEPNTRVLSETINKILSGSDSLSAGIIQDSTTQLIKTTKTLLGLLKTITGFQREAYKLKVRLTVLSGLQLTEKEISESEYELIRKIKRAFQANLPSAPFYPDLIKEIINEDYSNDGSGLKQAVLQKLAVSDSRTKENKAPLSYTTLLLESLKTLATAGPYLNDIRLKITENNQILQNRKLSFSERFKRWIDKIFGRSESDMIYTVEVVDPRTSTSKMEKINFLEYMTKLTKRSQVLTNLMKKSSPLFHRIEAAPEDKVYDFLSKNIEEVQLLLRTLPALDAYFRDEIAQEDRKRIRGSKLELNAVKNSLVKANQKKHEFVSKKEELEQLKRMGIDVTTA